MLLLLTILFRTMKADGDNALPLLKRLLTKIGERNAENDAAIANLLPELATEQEQERKAADDAAKQRKELLRRRQQEILARFKCKQQAFLETSADATASAGAEAESTADNADGGASNNTGSTLRSCEYECALCHVSTSPHESDSKIIGLISLVQRNKVVSMTHQRALGTAPDTATSDLLQINVTSVTTEQANDIDRPDDDDNTYVEASPMLDVNQGDSVDIKFCGHHIHLSCLYGYFSSLCESFETVCTTSNAQGTLTVANQCCMCW
jgi:hypothetical protein